MQSSSVDSSGEPAAAAAAAAAGQPSRKRSRSSDDEDDGGGERATRSTTSQLPPELASVDFSERISWGKCEPYSGGTPLPLVAEHTEGPQYDLQRSPALCHHVNAVSNRARACTVHLKREPKRKQGETDNQAAAAAATATPITTPMFMPVGTKGCLKGLSLEELTGDPALAPPIILANTYHLAIQPGTDLIAEMGGLHAFQGLDRITTTTRADDDEQQRCHQSYNLLTDSGGFQMVSLAKLSQVTEEGVSFENPFKRKDDGNNKSNNNEDGPSEAGNEKPEDMLLLRPEDSIRHQNNIGANIIMALDDVVSSVAVEAERFTTATYRTLRWYDRCYEAHAKKATQNLFPIVQGALDTELGGLRERCLAGFRHRELDLGYQVPGYAIGGLAGGESKDDFWRVVDQCCRALPDNKPRYLMGVGYPLDLVVCTALGVDLYDCVYPTRTARFGTCLVPGASPGTLRLRSHEYATDRRIIQDGCRCQACREGISRSRLHVLVKTHNPVAIELITQHNIAYMMALVRSMRQSILDGKFAEFAVNFVKDQFRGKGNGGDDPPRWVVEALAATGIEIEIPSKGQGQATV